jgi:structural maintenance of chromosome 1
MKEIEVDKANAVKERNEVENSGKKVQFQISELISQIESVAKKISGEEIQIEKLRGQLHAQLQRAQLEEISLPAIERSGTQSDASESAELTWHGSRVSSSGNSQSGSRRVASRATQSQATSIHFSQSENAAVMEDMRNIYLVDLSSIQLQIASNKMDVKKQLEKISKLQEEISAVSEELLAIQPNMHAADRYEGVIEKLKDCSDNLETIQQNAKSISQRFEDVRNLRHNLFMECFTHGKESHACYLFYVTWYQSQKL